MTATVDTPTEPATPSRQPSRRWIGFGIVWAALIVLSADALFAVRSRARARLLREREELPA